MRLEDLRMRVPGEEFDYQILMDLLQGYDKPRDKIRALLKSRTILRVKKGLYVFGPGLSRKPYSREVLANLIYGPSYISLEYALSYHGLIPERVETVTSCTTGRSRLFATPVGRFRYRQIPLKAYPPGIQRQELDAGRSFLIASPEKALADFLQADRRGSIRQKAEMEAYLFENLRLDRRMVRRMDARLLEHIAEAYASRKVRWLYEYVR